MQIWSAEIKELETLYSSIKGRFPELEKELEQLIKFDDANVILLYSRRCLEVIITDLCVNELKRPRGSEPLKGIIDKLSHEKKVPSNIIASMEGLNTLSTFGTHPKDFDPEQVKPVLSNLSIIIKWYLKYKNTQAIIKQKEEEVIDETKPPVVPGKVIHKPIKRILPWFFGLLLIALIIGYPLIFKRDRLESLKSTDGRISVAVMPFQNLTNDTTKNYCEEGIQTILTSNLSNYNEIVVRQADIVNYLIHGRGITNYASITPSVASKISRKLDAEIVLTGNIIPAGPLIRMTAQLINSNTKEILKSFQRECPNREENILQMTDSFSIIVRDFLILSILKKEETPEFQQWSGSTKSPEALRNFIDGKNAFMKRDYPQARELFYSVIEIDSNNIMAIHMLAFAFGNQGLYSDAKKWSQYLYEKRNKMSRIDKVYTEHLYAFYFGTPFEELKYLRQILDIDQLPGNYYTLGSIYNYIYQYERAIPEFERSLEIYKKWDIKPMWVLSYTNLGWAYHKTGQFKKEKKLYKKAEKDFPDDYEIIEMQAILSFAEGDTIEANRYIDKYTSIRKEKSESEADIKAGLAWIYSEAGIPDKAEAYLREAVSLEPESLWRMNALAYFLIDKDRNIDEGLDLVDTILKSDPVNYSYLHTKGWGLYKQGNYLEALDILQKSWDLRRKNAIYNHDAYLHLEEAKKAVVNQKNK